ncbi:hypothetical protein [Nocardia tengchongensis]|uniref:hypothetical protein n=1 Tax=Nocardia tengchongensis TaxID=2055889 RepID=UPI003656A8AE
MASDDNPGRGEPKPTLTKPQRGDLACLVAELETAVAERSGWARAETTGDFSVSTWSARGNDYYACVLTNVDLDGWYWSPWGFGNPLPVERPNASTAREAIERVEAAIDAHRAERVAAGWILRDE